MILHRSLTRIIDVILEREPGETIAVAGRDTCELVCMQVARRADRERPDVFHLVGSTTARRSPMPEVYPDMRSITRRAQR